MSSYSIKKNTCSHFKSALVFTSQGLLENPQTILQTSAITTHHIPGMSKTSLGNFCVFIATVFEASREAPVPLLGVQYSTPCV